MIAALAALVLQAPVTWIEGESAITSAAVNRTGATRANLLSEGRWLQIGVDPGEVEAKVPADGIVLDFPLTVQGRQNVWARIGYEFARSAFEWRVGDGTWKRVEPRELTWDLQELDTWTEVAWLPLGAADVPASARLQIRIPREKDEKGAWRRFLFALDALVLTPGEFLPNSKHKPGEEYRTDRDRAAAAKTFEAPPASPRSEVLLTGDWEIAREDEQEPPFDIAVPMEAPKKPLFWSAIQVPSDRNESRPDLIFAHRLWYRTRVQVPAAGGHFLEFERNNLNTTVYVNGQLCGFEKNPLVRFRVDVSKAVRPGMNEILVGIRDPWYGYSTNPTNPRKLREVFNRPLSVCKTGFQDLAYPIWNCFQSGILDPVRLVSAGPVYVDDVTIRTSVAKKTIEIGAELRSASPEGGLVEVDAEVVDPKTGTSVKKLGGPQVRVTGKASFQVEQAWENPELWWPDEPKLYELRLTVRQDGKVIDQSRTRFGFREWATDGMHYTLNGIRWRGWAELTQGDTPQRFAENYRKTGQRFFRLSGFSQNAGIRWKGLTFREALEFCDEQGLVVRRSGELDGQVIGYMAIENDPDLQKLYGSRIKMQLMRNWLDQQVAQVKAERNHPSIHVWSLENEWLYINCINLYADLMDEFEREVEKVGKAVMGADPTRLYMVDGGGAGKDQLFPVHGDHYVYTNQPRDYPDLAYQDFTTGGGRGRWTWDAQRPRYLGEDFFATGINPADYAWIGGESSFEGKVGAHPAIAKVQRILQEGYRWNGRYSFWHFWVGDEGAKFGKYIPNAEVAALVREYDASFLSGQTVRRTVRALNDSRLSLKLRFEWETVVGGKPSASGGREVSPEPGGFVEFPLEFRAPTVNARTEGELVLRLKVGPETVFEDRKHFAVHPAVQVSPSSRQAGVGLYDPRGTMAPVLRSLGLTPIPVADLAAIPASVQVLVVGPDAIREEDSSSTRLAAWALEGKRAIVLDQAHPLRFQAIPAEVNTALNRGAFAFPEDASHPALRGVQALDLQAWPGQAQGWSYRNAYDKPTRGARSLIQCDRRLGSSALVEVPVGTGLMLLSQMRVGDAVASSAGARRLLVNLIDHAVAYRFATLPTTLVAPAGSQLARAVAATGVRFTAGSDVVAALAKPGVVVADASPANLAKIVSAKAQLDKFTASGGTLLLHGLTPVGLADYNRIVGVQHMIRPFRRERVLLATPRDPLAAGITLSDVALLSSERLFAWTSDMYAAKDTFSYIVDLRDAAPFAQFPSDYHHNIVNGFVSADGWPYIFSFEKPDQNPPVFEMVWPSAQTFEGMEWIGNGFYHYITKFRLTFDGKDNVDLDVLPNIEPQSLAIEPPRTGSRVRFQALEWRKTPNVNDVIGIDNLRLFVRRDPTFSQRVKPLLNIGGIVRYPMGTGNVVLCNLNFLEREEVPVNGDKKRAILAALLRNLKAPMGEGKPIIAGASGIRYTPIDLSKSANQFRTERGWFGDAATTFKDLPIGRQTFAQVPFDVFEFPTSPVPTAVMLGGPGVPGGLPEQVEIPVGRTAAALFFLQTARLDQRRNDQDRREGRRFRMAEYVVAYADGSTETIPLYAEEDLDDFRQAKPASLPGAALAWSKPYEGRGVSGTAWVKQWSNPHPDRVIRSVTVRYGPDRRGVPVLLALTAAS